MLDELPWDDYRRDRLRPGMSYPFGRDLVERSLRDAGAAVGSLAFAVPANGYPISPGDQNIIEVFWFGRAAGRQPATAPDLVARRVYMRVWAVPSARRHEVSGPLAAALPAACRWIAAGFARGQDSVWAATDHELTVRCGSRGALIHED